jgi:hypothetical protein
MPIKVEQSTPEVYVLEWSGHVTLDEVKESNETVLQMATAAGVTQYVHILTAGENIRFPLNGIGLSRIVRSYPQVIGILIVDPPRLAEKFITLLTGMLGHAELEVFDTLDEARQRAADLLAE